MTGDFARRWEELDRQEALLNEARWRLVQEALDHAGDHSGAAALLDLPSSVVKKYTNWDDHLALVVHEAQQHDARRGWWANTTINGSPAQQYADSLFHVPASRQEALRAVIYVNADHTIVRIRPVEYRRVWPHNDEHRIRAIPVGPLLTLQDVRDRFPTLPLLQGMTRERPAGVRHDYVAFRRPGTSQVEIDATPAPGSALRVPEIRADL